MEYILGAPYFTELLYTYILSPWDRSEATAALPPLERTRRWLESPRRSSRVSWPLWGRGLGFAWKRVLSVYSTAKGDRSETLFEDAAGRRWWPEMGGCGEWSWDAYKIISHTCFSKCGAYYQFAASIEHIGYRFNGDDADTLWVGERNCCMHLNSGSVSWCCYLRLWIILTKSE